MPTNAERIATLEQAVDRLELRQTKLRRWLKRLYKTLHALACNGVLPSAAAKTLGNERKSFDGDDS
jgi:hypothetical protein